MSVSVSRLRRVWMSMLAIVLGGALEGCAGCQGAVEDEKTVAEGAACEVQAMLETRCATCHGSPPTQGAPSSFLTLDDLRAPSTRVAGQTNAERSLARISESGPVQMPPPPADPVAAEQIEALQRWINGGMPTCASDGGTHPAAAPNPNLIPQAELFSCQGAVSDAPTRVRRLNRWQWTRNVGGSVTRSWTGFSFFDNPFDPSAGERYSSYATDETLDEATIELFLPVLSEAGPLWAGPYASDKNSLERLAQDTSLRCMFNDARPSASCVRHFLSEFLLHGVLFRPATMDELDRLHAFATAVLAAEPAPDGGSGTRTRSITRISNAAWLTAGAMFRTEGTTSTSTEARVELSNWELGQELAYAVGNRGPGATPTFAYPYFSAPVAGHLGDIAGAAADGGIRDGQVAETLFRNNAGGTDPNRLDLVQDWGTERRSRRGEYWLADGVSGFFREWLGYTRVSEIFKERPEATSAYDDGSNSPYRPQLGAYLNQVEVTYGSESTLVQQLDDAIARVVVADSEVLKNLLTTRQYFLAATSSDFAPTQFTGQVYGTTQSIAATQSARWVTLPSTQRAGVLTHPAWLSSHGGNFEDDPSIVHRGKWVRENLLCGYVPPLSEVRVQAQVGPHAPNKSARVRLDEATGKTECSGCHSLMNPLGYPFEIYNHAGYLRAGDRAADGGTAAPSGASVLTGMPDPSLDGPVQDAVQLSEKFANSAHVKRCFVRQAFRYYMGRDENRSDACTLAQMEQAYDSSGGSFFKMVGALLRSDTWKVRRVPGGGE
ncbi:MAG: DUF1588 domain-containing protein [Myxococcaceae bacterium]